MGYEVLDSGGSASGRPPSGAADLTGATTDVPTDVIDLGEMRHEPPDDDAAPLSTSRRRGSTASTRLAATAVALALVIGAVLGGLLTRRQSALAAEQQRQSTLAVSAQATHVTPFPLPLGVGAELLVTVQNLGPSPVEVLVTQNRQSMIERRARVMMLGDDASIEPGASARVEMRIPADCRPRRVLVTKLPVRTADGVEHSVPVTMPDEGRPPVGLCPQGRDDASLQATLTGTVLLPTLQLVNLTDRTLQVDLPRQGLYPLVANSVMSVVPRPQMPVEVPPRGQVAVGLRFVARSCIQELQDLQRLDIADLTLEVALLTPDGAMQAGSASVDVTAVVAAAMVRRCG